MIFFERSVRPSQSVLTRVRGLTGPGLQLQVIHQTGCHFDTAALQGLHKRIRPGGVSLTVCLRGNYRSGSGTSLVVLRPGEVAVERRDSWVEEWSNAEQLFVTLLWTDPDAQPLERTALTTNDRRQWAALAHGVLDHGWSRERILLDLSALTRRLGIDLPPYPAIPDERTRAIRRVLNRLTTHLHIGPQWQDLADPLELSERQLRRHLREDEGFLTSGQGLREFLLHGRLVLGWRLKTAGGLGTSEIATALGYRSGRAFQTAFRRAGLTG